MVIKTYYFPRFFARLFDLLIVGLLLQVFERFSPHHSINLLICYIVYNLVVILFGGRSLGKYSFSLKIETKHRGLRRIVTLVVRELLFVILSPILVINVVCVAPYPLHDRLCGTEVVKNEF
ncbi:RDD family protein [bacterium]|nr:RDD family protein [bacterium]